MTPRPGKWMVRFLRLTTSKLFGRGKIGRFNRNNVGRLGWSWKGGAHDGSNVFRAALGSKRNRFGIHLHYTMMRGIG